MVISEPAVWVMESAARRWLRRLFGTGFRRQERAESMPSETGALLPSSVTLFDADGHVAHETMALPAHRPLATDAPNQTQDEAPSEHEPEEAIEELPNDEPLTVNERRARVVAVRALMRARDGRFDQARELFAEAAALDPGLRLSTVPTFWSLARGGQQAAVEGYELAGRQREASLLAAELEYTFRPKLVRRRPLTNAPAPSR